MADKAWAAGWNVVRLNQRNCGGTERLSRGLYHSGLTHDPLFVMRELIDADGLPAIAIAGYSLGGNLALKLAGELGDDAPPQLSAVCAVSPTMDLAVCVRRAGAPRELSLSMELRSQPQGADAAEGGGSFPATSRWSRSAASGRCASSTRPTRRRITASGRHRLLPPRQRRCARSTGSASRR